MGPFQTSDFAWFLCAVRYVSVSSHVFFDLDFLLSLGVRGSPTRSRCPEVGLGFLFFGVLIVVIFDGAMSFEDASRWSSWCPEVGLGVPKPTSGHLASFLTRA